MQAGRPHGQSACEAPQIDDIDRRILELLQQDARSSRADVGRAVGLSAAAVHERIKKLERAGVITRYAALLDPQRAGRELLVFVEVTIDGPGDEPAFLDEVADMPAVQECHRVSGPATWLVKVRVPNRESLRDRVLDRLRSLSGVRTTGTIVVLSTTKETPQIDLGG